MKKYGERRVIVPIILNLVIAPVILSLGIRWSCGQRQASIALSPVLTEYEVGGRRPFTEDKDLFHLRICVFYLMKVEWNYRNIL
jgi:hypothetical protein